ncbi:TPA: DUF551 domain-containing protein [Citrobacter freundii]|nr:DUF551 domain-containing protein [Citrobacter freundii]
MDKFTKEQQVQAVYDLKVGYTLGHADIAMLKSMARQLLASMEQEPVAYMQIDGDEIEYNGHNEFSGGGKGVPLYAAPQLPQPAVPDEIDVNDPALDTHRKWMAEGWNRCRAAMLQAEPVSNSDELPDSWVACSERMPSPNQYVLVCNGVWVGMGMHNNSEHLGDDERWQDEHGEFIDLLHHPVTHWQLLPTAPQQEVNRG